MILRVPQREQEDCAVCALAMVMGPPYSYERVRADSEKYAKVSPDGIFLPWWGSYLQDEGFHIYLCNFDGLYALPVYDGNIVALLEMSIPHLNRRHIVAVDEIGVVDPADNAPAHVELGAYVRTRQADGAVFRTEFLAVKRA